MRKNEHYGTSKRLYKSRFDSISVDLMKRKYCKLTSSNFETMVRG